jgi:acetoin utilization deacetylase AcuC-like enzyme
VGENETHQQRSRVALVRSRAFLGHETGQHPENPRRLPAIDAALRQADLVNDRPEISFLAAEREALERVHDPRYLDLLEEITAQGGAWLDGDTVVTPDSLATATLAAGAGIAAVDAALDGIAPRSFALVRQPGHHATRERGMGFCLINNVAVAAGHALSRGLERIAIVDWDVHHGNGTQGIFYSDPSVYFFSMHQYPWYPGTGSRGETGHGRGLGYTLNVPVKANTKADDQRRVFDAALYEISGGFKPDMILNSAGFEADLTDALGQLILEDRDFRAMTSAVKLWANETCGGRIVSCLEGGYNLETLGTTVKNHILELGRA